MQNGRAQGDQEEEDQRPHIDLGDKFLQAHSRSLSPNPSILMYRKFLQDPRLSSSLQKINVMVPGSWYARGSVACGLYEKKAVKATKLRGGLRTEAWKRWGKLEVWSRPTRKWKESEKPDRRSSRARRRRRRAASPSHSPFTQKGN